MVVENTAKTSACFSMSLTLLTQPSEVSRTIASGSGVNKPHDTTATWQTHRSTCETFHMRKEDTVASSRNTTGIQSRAEQHASMSAIVQIKLSQTIGTRTRYLENTSSLEKALSRFTTTTNDEYVKCVSPCRPGRRIAAVRVIVSAGSGIIRSANRIDQRVFGKYAGALSLKTAISARSVILRIGIAPPHRPVSAQRCFMAASRYVRTLLCGVCHLISGRIYPFSARPQNRHDRS